jgi:hypothetical protein
MRKISHGWGIFPVAKEGWWQADQSNTRALTNLKKSAKHRKSKDRKPREFPPAGADFYRARLRREAEFLVGYPIVQLTSWSRM